MPLYFLIMDSAAFHEHLRPVLTECWRRHSLVPARALCAELLPRARDFIPSAADEQSVLAEVAHGLPFDRQRWWLLAGELLLFTAIDMPVLETAPDTLRCLLEPHRFREGIGPRADFSAIDQVHYGARELTFGDACYRPDHAGWNDVADVERLAGYLAATEPSRWTADDLKGLAALPDADRADELEFVREWFPELQELYRRSAEARRVIVCEDL